MASLAALVASLLVVIAVISALFAHRSRQELTRRRRELYISDMNVARQAWEENNVGRVVELLKRHVPDGSVPDLRGLEWYLLWNFCQRSLNTPTMQLSSDARRVAFSSDGNWLAVCSRNGKVRLRDTRTRCDLVRSFPIEGRRFHEFFVAFTPHDKSVAFPGNTVSTITILDLSSHQQRPITVGGEDPIIDIDFSPDGTVAAVAIADGSIAILDFQSGNIFKRWKAHERYTTSVVYSPDGSVLVSSGRDATVRLWDAVSTKEIKTFHSEDQVWSLAFSSDGSRLASAGWDKLIRIVEMATQEEIEVLTPGQGKLRAVAFSDDGRMLASAGRDNTVKLWNARTFSEIDTFKGHSSLVWSVAFQPTSKTLASGSMDNTVMLWNVETPNEQRVLPANYQVRDLAFTADSGTLATLEYLDDKVRLWDTEDGRRLAPISVDSPLLEFAVSACKTLAAGGQDGLITLCDLSQNECSITIESGLETVRALSFSPDGRLVAAASFDEVALWNADNGQLHQRFEDVGQALAFSPTGEMIATVSHDNRIVVKDVASGSLVENFPGHKDAVSSLAFSPTGDVLASGSLDMTAKVWKIGQPDPLAAFQVWARIWDLTFSGGKGNTLITVAGDGDVEFWDMGSHQHRFTLRMDGRSGMSVAVSPDERFLAAGSLNDDTLRLWRAATPEEVAACEPWQDIVNGKR
ncbi:MAG: WD40 repeat domain-containing protein [Pirellulaceae bacterium]